MPAKRKSIESSLLSGAITHDALFDVLLSVFPERSVKIVRSRFGIDDGLEQTLESIGRRYSITRERVRQIVDVALRHIREVIAVECEHALVRRVQELIREAGGMLSVDRLLTLATKPGSREERALRSMVPILPKLKFLKADATRKSSVMLVDFSLSEWQTLIKTVKSLLEEMGDVCTIDELYSRYIRKYNGQTFNKETLISLLEPSLEIEKNVFGQYGLAHWGMVKPRGTRERAHLILRVTQKPLHFRDIAKLIDEHGLYKSGKKTHPQTVHNELIKDDRFVLVGRGTYALSDWGYRPGTVREVLAAILKENEKPMTREELLKAVMKVRQVKRSTVIINLNSFFAKVGKNIYSLSEMSGKKGRRS